MPDPVDPIPPVPPAPVAGRFFANDTTGLPSNVAAALACIPLIGGIIFYVLEKRDSFVRFYAMQSIMFGGAWMIFSIIWRILFAILAPIPVIGLVFAFVLWILWVVWNLGAIVLWIITMIKAFSGKHWEIPYLGPIARKQVDGASAL